MSRILKLLFFVALVLVPTAAFATDMEYYTYGGFQPIVSAFKLIAAIFGNNSYKALFYTVVVSAASFAGLAALAKLTAGGNGSILGWTVPMLIGIAFYIALFIPTGKLVVYDSVLNKQEEVAGVPNGVVLVAGTFNLIERGLVEIISDSSSAGCYQKQAGGKGFLGLYNLCVRPLSSSVDTYLEQNLGDYIADCVTFAVNNPSSTLSIDEIRRTPVSFMASLAKASNPAIFTKYYNALEKNGSSATCAESWTAIQADINEADALSGNILSTCTEAGYNVTQPGELNACRAALKDAQDYVGLGNLGLDEFVKQLFIQQRLDNAYKSGNTTLVSNYKFLTQTSGAMKSFNEFYPMLRGVLTAVAIALIPILVIFLPTPMAGKIGTIIFGFFVWLTSWGVVDAILHGFGMEFSNMVFDNVRSGNLGLDGLYFFPDASVKALAIFGTLRMSGLMLSTALTGMLIKFGGHAVAQMASGFQSQITGAGSQAASQTENVTGQGKAMQELTTSAGSGPTSAWGSISVMNRVSAADARLTGTTASALGELSEFGDSFANLVDTKFGMGRFGAGAEMGSVLQYNLGKNIGHRMGMSEKNIHRVQSMHKLNPAQFATTMQALQAQGAALGKSGDEMAAMYFEGKAIDDMSGRSIGNIDGFNLGMTASGGETTTIASKGLMKLTWGSGGLLQDASGFHANVDYARGYDLNYSQKILDSQAETATHLGSTGWNYIDSFSRSNTRSALTALGLKSSLVQSGIQDTNRSVETSISQLAERAETITDSKGNTIQKGSDAWTSVTASVKAGVEFLGSGGSAKTDMTGRKSVEVKTSSGHTYTLSFGERDSRQLSERVGQTWRDSISRTKGTELSATDQTALAEAQNLTHTKSSLELVTASEQRTKSLESAKTEAMRISQGDKTALDAAFVSWLGNRFGEGIKGDISAANHIQDLAADGSKQALEALNTLRDQFIAEKGIKPDGKDLPTVEGPTAKMPDRSNVLGVGEVVAGDIDDKLKNGPCPVGAPTSTRAEIVASKPLNGLKGPSDKGYRRYMAAIKGNMEDAGKEMEKINNSPIAPDLLFWGQVASPSASGASGGYVYGNVMPSEIFDGIGDTTSKALGAIPRGIDATDKAMQNAVKSVVPRAPDGYSGWGAYVLGQGISAMVPEENKDDFIRGLGGGTPPFRAEGGAVTPSTGFSVTQEGGR